MKTSSMNSSMLLLASCATSIDIGYCPLKEDEFPFKGKHFGHFVIIVRFIDFCALGLEGMEVVL
jgi:hypothetical protein